MKSDVALDHAVFQLTPSRNRCELVVVCGEEIERLASGLLKPFLVHLKAAEDQYATGTKEIKLKPPPGYGYGSKPETSAWFTKGTIERFVRFVSTPEVLERVGTVEAELVQLDGAIREHAFESTKVDASQSSTTAPNPSAASSLLVTATTDQAPTPTPSRRNSLDEAENDIIPAPDDNARRRLLRAMEARKMLLHKEQGMAFARATAAGFDMQKMEHLLVFSDCFGANRLGDACVMYTSIFKKSKESGFWDENEWPLSDTTSLRNVPTSPELRPRDSDMWSDMHSEAGDFRLDELRDDVSVRSYSNYYSEDLSLRGYAGGDYRKAMLSPRRDFIGDFSRSRGGSNQTSWDEGSRMAQGQDMAARAYADDNMYSGGHSRRFPSISSHHSDMLYNADSVNDSGNDLDGSKSGGRAQRQRRAWGPPPQYLAHQLPVGMKAKSGPLVPGHDGFPMAVAAAGQFDQPWRPGSADANGHGAPRLVVPKYQAHGVAGNGNLQSTLAAEPVVKPPEANGNVLPSPAASWQEHKRRQVVGVQDKAGSGGRSHSVPAVSNFASVRDAEGSRPAVGKTGDRSQAKPVMRRTSSPRRRSASPMRRVQVGRNSMRRSGVMIMKSVNYASTKPVSNAGTPQKESESSDDDTDDGPGEQNGGENLGHDGKGGVRVDTGLDSFANATPDQSPTRASSGWNYEMNYLENGSNHAPSSQSGPPPSPKEPKGRYYTEYSEKRDAKLRDESESKKAERDAKLKSMQEVLEHRKAEMTARKGRGVGKQNSDGEAQVLAEKLRSSKMDALEIKRKKDDDEAKRLEEIANQRRERIAARSSPSPPAGTAPAVSATTTPRAAEKQQQPSTPTALPTLIPTPSLTPKPKPSAARRLSSPKRFYAGAFRGMGTLPAAAAGAAAAPVSAPKSVRSSQRLLPQSALAKKEVENPLSRSVPNLAELRKENTKPSLVRNSTYNERPRSTGSKVPGMRGAPAPLEANGKPSSREKASADEKEKKEKDKNEKRRVGTRKSIGSVTETLPEAAPVLVPLKASKTEKPAEQASAASKPSKRLSLSAATADSKPFLRKGRGIGPGSGPNVRKSKVAAAPEPTSKVGLEDAEAEKSVSDSEHEEAIKAEVYDVAEDQLDAVNSMSSSVNEEKGGSLRADLPEASASQAWDADASSVGMARPSSPCQNLALVLDDDDEMIRPEEWQEPEDMCRPDDNRSSRSDHYGTHAEPASENSLTSTLRHFLSEGVEIISGGITGASGTATPSLRSSPIHSIPLRCLSPTVSQVLPAISGDAAISFQGRYEVPFRSMLDGSSSGVGGVSSSPAMSPTPLQLQLISHSPDTKLRKKWLSSQKVLAPAPVKESPRGLKRLLKFGLKKKDRSSAASTTSDSPSDIDDDFDFASMEHGHGPTNELTHIGAKSLGSRMAGKASGALVGPPAIPEDSATEGDAEVRLVSIPFVRSSIPTAPAHFKTRDEHVGGSSLLKAPRSFFSLSSFRSKVGK